ncbi:MAG: tRNA uridine-5-carboxymethylaminomethyl(34) synthesis GTPase MnmE [Elusimicrobia bacterium]|nr:tRNA uridine-5-carboxymethylaminomethyl(34) synthesis GTPase MnmE [Elusimicrobiota bacterium]
MTATETTIVALATPPGRSALGTVRISGPMCLELARALLGTAPEPRRATALTLRRKGTAIDRVVATYWAGPSTPTGEDLLELSAHGSPEILREIVEAALEAGARAAAPGEFTRRAYVNGRLDLAQARAVGDLIAARGKAARAAAFKRLEGGLGDALDKVRAPLLELLAALEVRLDHPEEDIAPLSGGEADLPLEHAAASLQRLVSGYARGRARREGARVGLFGSPNAGKSSLLNALLGRERAITSPEPGTTRDLLEEQAEFSGAPVTLIDTAGLHGGAAGPAEREGVARAERALESCEVAILVVDASRPANEQDEQVRATVSAAAARRGARLIVALNKMDLAGGRSAPGEGLACSALTGEGIAQLEAAIAAAGGGADDEGETLLDDARGAAALAEALAEIGAARTEIAARPNAWEDRAADRLRRALSLLNETRGDGAPEDVLDEIFSKFCVGK